MSDSASISRVFERYSGMVYRRALAILADPQEAKDVTQDVFVRGFLEGAAFEGRSDVTTWLYRITTNVCLNRIRDRDRRRALLAKHAESEPEGARPAPELLLAIRQVLAASEEQAARAAVYVYIDGMSHREAAEVLGVAKRTVGNLLERFQKFAVAALDPKEDIDATR